MFDECKAAAQGRHHLAMELARQRGANPAKTMAGWYRVETVKKKGGNSELHTGD